MRKYEEELEVLIKAGAKVVEIASFEWERVHGFVNDVAEDLNVDWYSWSSVSGLKVYDESGFKVVNPDCVTLSAVLDYYIKNENDMLLVLEDFHPYSEVNNPVNIRYIREMMRPENYHGDYRKAIINLGITTNTTVIDLTERTKELYIKIGYDKAILFHAWPKNKKETVDTTHLNIYGAKMVAYLFAEELKKTDCNLKNYLLQDLIKPTIKDLIPNKEYIDLPYVPFNKDKYKPTTNFSHIKLEGWYGTAFGDTGSNPLDLNTGYIIKEENNKFIIGQDGQYLKGKIANTEGIPFLFKQINKDDNFKVNVDVKIIKKKVDDMAGFGLMLRDDVYTDQSIPDNTILSNYVAAGLYNDNEKTNIIYSRENRKCSYHHKQ